MTRPLILLSLVLSVYSSQTAPPIPIPTAPRPLENIAKPSSVAELEFNDFEFLAPGFGHAGISLRPLDGEPVAGKQYGVEARIWREDAMAQATFHVLDEGGQVMHTLAMGRKSELWNSRFLGMMTVPAKPFRIALSGEGTDGRPFRRVGKRLFRPLGRAPAPAALDLPPDVSPAEAKLFQQMLDKATGEVTRELKEFTENHAAEMIVIPRVQVSNVTYAPFMSPAGRPLGIRITYDVEFSAPGIHNPELRVEADYPPSVRQGITRMQVVNSSITPLPREAYQPWKEPEINQYRTTILGATAQFTYQERTVYHFMAELVPDFIVYNADNTKQCIYRQKHPSDARAQARLLEIMESDAPASYRIGIRSTAGFTAKIENFYGEGVFYRSFVAQGAPDCGVQPTRFF